MASPKEAVEQAWARAQVLAEETDGWKEEKRDDVAVLTSKLLEGCPVNCFKVVGGFPCLLLPPSFVAASPKDGD